jgi:hypothetical protein
MAWIRAEMFRASPMYSSPDTATTPWSMPIRKRALLEPARSAFLVSISVVMAMAVRIASIALPKTAMKLSPTKLTSVPPPSRIVRSTRSRYSSIVAVIASRSSATSRLYPTTSALRATISERF